MGIVHLFKRRILLIVCSVAIIIIAAVATCIIFARRDTENQRSDLNTPTTQTPTSKPRYTAPSSVIIDAQGNVSCNPEVEYGPDFVITYQDKDSGKQKVISCSNN